MSDAPAPDGPVSAPGDDVRSLIDAIQQLVDRIVEQVLAGL